MKKKLIALLMSLTFILCLFSCGGESHKAKSRCDTCMFGAWTTTVQPTCQTTGTGVRTCSVCGYEESKTIPILSHNAPNGICTYCQKVTNAYNAMVYYVKQNGSYDSSDRDYTFFLGTDVSDVGSKYTRAASYDVAKKGLSLHILCDFSDDMIFISITVIPNSSIYSYNLLYSYDSVNYYMLGSLNANTFSNSTNILPYTYCNAPAYLKTNLAELGATTVKLLLTFLNSDLKEFNITPKDLGFKYF